MRKTKAQKIKHKKLNTNKGITLIALVVTIIVMLILVAVTISMAINGGLFGYAGKAAGDTQNAIDAEQQLGSGKVQIDGVWYDSIDDYIAGKPSSEGEKRILITYDYDKTEGIEFTTVNLNFQIEGMPTLEEFAEDYVKNKTKSELEELFVKGIYPGSFDEFLVAQSMTREQFEQAAKEETGLLEYEEALRLVVKNSEYVKVEYKMELVGGTNKDEKGLEELYVKCMNYPGSFDDFLTEQNMTRADVEQMAQTQLGLTYKDFLKFMITQSASDYLSLKITISNGQVLECSYFDLQASFEALYNGTYEINAEGVKGEIGEESIVISNIKRVPKVGDYVNYTPDIGTYKVADEQYGSGYKTAEGYQEFTTETGDDVLQWRILSIDEKTGEIELISASVAQEKGLYLKGADGYNHGVDILNDLCKTLYSKQINGENVALARSIKIEDINKKTFYDYKQTNTNWVEPITKYGDTMRLFDTTGTANCPNIYLLEKGYGESGVWNDGLDQSSGLNDGKIDQNGISTYSTVSGETDPSELGENDLVTHTAYWYSPREYLRTDLGLNNAPESLFHLSGSYWIATRCLNLKPVILENWDPYNPRRFEIFYYWEGSVLTNWMVASAPPVDRVDSVRPVVSLVAGCTLKGDITNSTKDLIYWNIEY